ncbi:MAG: hypothetical protein JOZ80_10540 [Acidobacteriaceae bacterium]|nr:hypothetical protein [Acidobacteriaceae bacterium]
MKWKNRMLGLAVLALAQLASAQMQVGDNTKLNAGALLTFGYTGNYGDAIPSSHGLDLAVDGKFSGYYYNPNFISFDATPYYNRSNANSSSQSLTGASGILGSANFFTGSKYPGSVSYHYDANSTGTFGLVGQPNFTTYGRGQGFGINWSALLPNMPTLSVGYSQGSGHSTVYGTSDEANSSTRLLNLHSNYDVAGFRLNGFYNHTTVDSKFPEFLAGEQEAIQNSTGQDVGVGAQHSLPFGGLFNITYDHANADTRFASTLSQNNKTSYDANNENMTTTFHPNEKLTLNVTQSYTDNLTGYLTQSISNSGTIIPGLNLGSGSHSSTFGGGAGYRFTTYLSASAQATYYDQAYFGKTYTGRFLSGTVNYDKRLLDMFTLSASVIDSSNGQGTNALGFMGNVNFFRNFRGWQTAGAFSYAQNVQTLLVTYTTSYYNYSANVRRRIFAGINWTAAFNGTHSGLNQYSGATNSAETYSTSFSMRKMAINGIYTNSTGISLLGAGGLVTPTPIPGLTDFVSFNGTSYGGGVSVTPVRKLTISGNYSRAISNTIGSTYSHNNTQIINSQLQYHLRKIGVQASYTRFSQGISALGTPANTTSFFVGVTRWFDIF